MLAGMRHNWLVARQCDEGIIAALEWVRVYALDRISGGRWTRYQLLKIGQILADRYGW